MAQAVLHTVARELAADGIARAAGAVAVRVAALDDEARHHAVERQAVIEARVRQRNEVAHGLRRDLRVQLAVDEGAVVHGDGEGRVLHLDGLRRRQRSVVHGQRRFLLHSDHGGLVHIALEGRARHGHEGIRLAVNADVTQHVEGRARSQLRHDAAAGHVGQVRLGLHTRVGDGRINRLRHEDVVEAVHLAHLDVRLVEHRVDERGVILALLRVERLGGLGLLAGLEVRRTGGQILRIAEDEVAKVGGHHVGHVADALQRHRARGERVAVGGAALGHRIAQRQLLLGGGILVVLRHDLVKGRAALNERKHGLGLLKAGHLGNVLRLGLGGFGFGRLGFGGLALGRLGVALRLQRDVDALHAAHVLRRVEDVLLVQVRLDEGVHVGVAGLRLFHLRVEGGADLLVGDGRVFGRHRVEEL